MDKRQLGVIAFVLAPRPSRDCVGDRRNPAIGRSYSANAITRPDGGGKTKQLCEI